MQKMRDAPSEKQLELEFGTLVETSEAPLSVVSNVVRVQFGTPRSAPPCDNTQDQELLVRILQNAQKLNW